jgi:hypothetical protein
MFLTKLTLEVAGEQTFILTSPLVYQEDSMIITVYPGFDFDGASIPQVLWSIIGSPMTGGYQKAACLHDALYSSKLFSKKHCDLIFYRAMIGEGTNSFKAYIIYSAVKIAGGWAYEDSPDIQKYRNLVNISLI